MYMGESIAQRGGTFHTEDLTVWGSPSLFVASSLRPLSVERVRDMHAGLRVFDGLPVCMYRIQNDR